MISDIDLLKLRKIFDANFTFKDNVSPFLAMFCCKKEYSQTIRIINKNINSYYDDDIIYVIDKKINSENFKDEVKWLINESDKYLKIDKNHFASNVHFVIFSSLEEKVEKKISKYHKTKLLCLGLKGHLYYDIIGIDVAKEKVVSNKYNKSLVKVLKESVFSNE